MIISWKPIRGVESRGCSLGLRDDIIKEIRSVETRGHSLGLRDDIIKPIRSVETQGFPLGFSTWVFRLGFPLRFSTWVFHLDFPLGSRGDTMISILRNDTCSTKHANSTAGGGREGEEVHGGFPLSRRIQKKQQQKNSPISEML